MNKKAIFAKNIYADPDFDPSKEVLRATKDTFSRVGQALFGHIAYLNGGARLYQEFIEAHGKESEQTDSQKLFARHGPTIATDIKDIERLIVIGGGSYNSFQKQELSLVNELYGVSERTPKLKEIVLVDVSDDFLHQQIEAIEDFVADTNSQFKVIPIRSDFQKVAGKKFDTILQEYGAKPRDQVKAAVIATGATFGNFENPVITGSIPTHDIDVRMAQMGEFVGIGSTVIFDYFTKLDAAEGYYNTPELSAFFTNIPHVIQLYCGNALQDFHQNSPDIEDGIYFRYRAKTFYDSRLIAHQLVAERPQQPLIKNGTGERLLTIGANDKFTMMYSFRPRTEDIQNRPARNTGLLPEYHVSNGDLVTHICTKLRDPEVLHPDSDVIAEQKMTRKARSPGATISEKASNTMRKLTPSLRPVLVGYNPV